MFDWINFLTYAIITAATPGPNNIMSMSNTNRLGFKKSFPFNLGIWLGFTIVMLICTSFSNSLHTFIPTIKIPMLTIGAGYMLYLAWKTFKSSSKLDENYSQIGFVTGFILQFINPKIYIYCIVSMEAYILPIFQGNILVLLSFALLLSTIGFIFTVCWSIFGSLFIMLFSKYAKTTNMIMALLLVYCAFSLFI